MKRALTAAVLSALVTAAVLATVGFGAATKSGSSKKSSSVTSQTATTPPPTMKEALAADEKTRAERHAKLAKSLDVTAEKLTTALDAVKKKNLDKAVTDNKLTAAQRDAIVACEKAPLTCDRSNLPAYGFRGGHGGRGGHPGIGGHGGRGGHPGIGGPGGTDFVKALAAELGIAEDKVTAALKANRPTHDGHRDRGGDDDRRGGHGGRGGHGFGPPPGMDGASAPATAVAPSASA